MNFLGCIRFFRIEPSEVGKGERLKYITLCTENGSAKGKNNFYCKARKYDNLLKRNFTLKKPFEKCVTNITEFPAKDGEIYVSALFDCYYISVLGLDMANNLRAELCVRIL